MARAAICPATILLLAVAVFASVSNASRPLAAAEATTDHAITKEKSNLLPVPNDHDKEEMKEAKAGGQQGSVTEKITSSVSAEEEGKKKTGYYWGKAKKLDDDDDSDFDHDHDHDSDSDHDHDSDSDHDHNHDSDSDHDYNHDSDRDSDDNDDDDDDHKWKNERKKNHAAQGRKGAPGSKRDDDQLPKIVKRV